MENERLLKYDTLDTERYDRVNGQLDRDMRTIEDRGHLGLPFRPTNIRYVIQIMYPSLKSV